MDLKEKLKELTAVYLNDEVNFAHLYAATKELKALLIMLAGTDHDSHEGKEPIHTDNGKAIGPYWAAMCVDDIMRTRRFVRGVYHAMADMLNAREGKINLLYAGTGPFAMLVLPSILRFSPERVNYTFLEINPITFKTLQRVLNTLGMEAFRIELVQADASRYVLDKENLPNIIISETMQNMLAREQQVPIFLNLMRQAQPHTVFIPESIELFVGVRATGKNETEITRNDYRKLDCVFAVNRQTMAERIDSTANGREESFVFNERKTLVKDDAAANTVQPVLFTEVQVYKDERLLINESGLTTPKTLHLNGISEGKPICIKTRYKIDKEPKLEYEILEAD